MNQLPVIPVAHVDFEAMLPSASQKSPAPDMVPFIDALRASLEALDPSKVKASAEKPGVLPQAATQGAAAVVTPDLPAGDESYETPVRVDREQAFIPTNSDPRTRAVSELPEVTLQKLKLDLTVAIRSVDPPGFPENAAHQLSQNATTLNRALIERLAQLEPLDNALAEDRVQPASVDNSLRRALAHRAETAADIGTVPTAVKSATTADSQPDFEASDSENSNGALRHESEPTRQVSLKLTAGQALELRSAQHQNRPVDVLVNLRASQAHTRISEIPNRPYPVWQDPAELTALSKAAIFEGILQPTSTAVPQIQTMDVAVRTNPESTTTRSREQNSIARRPLKGAVPARTVSAPPVSESRQHQVRPLHLGASVAREPGLQAGPGELPTVATDFTHTPTSDAWLSRMQQMAPEIKQVEGPFKTELLSPTRFVIEDVKGNRPVQSIRVQLEPAHLGKVNIHLRHSRGGVHARIVAEQVHALPIVEHEMAAIRTALSSRGIEFASFSLTAATAAQSAGSRPTAKLSERRTERREALSVQSNESKTLKDSARKAHVQ